MKEKWHAIPVIPKESWSVYINVKVDLSPQNIISGEEGTGLQKSMNQKLTEL